MRSNIPQVYIIHSANSSAGCDGGGQPGVHGEAGGGKGVGGEDHVSVTMHVSLSAGFCFWGLGKGPALFHYFPYTAK